MTSALYGPILKFLSFGSGGGGGGGEEGLRLSEETDSVNMVCCVYVLCCVCNARLVCCIRFIFYQIHDPVFM